MKGRNEVVRIADLICDETSGARSECELIVDPNMSVEEVLRKMDELGCKYVGVETEEGKASVLSKETVLKGLLCEFDEVQNMVNDLERQIEVNISDQIDLIQEKVHTLAEDEKNKLEVAIENMSEGVVILGRRGEVNRANLSARQMLGLNRESGLDYVAKAIDELGFRDLVASSEQDELKRSGEFTIKSKSDRILQMRWTEMIDEWDHFLGNVVMIRDITDDIASEKAKTEFIASISHELRTPLTSIQNSVSNILAGVTGKVGKKTREYLYTMKSDCHRFADLINDLLDMAKLEAGSMPVNRRVMNIVSIVSEAVKEFSAQAKSKNIELVCEIDGHISPVYADSQRIQQVMWNLVGNAIRFTGKGGRVTLRSYDSGNDVITVVEDTGIGISPSLQKQVFNKFYQIRRQAGPGSKGSGLGLAICSGIIAVHGGSIWVESEEGKGSKFYFSLPKTDPFVVLYKQLSALSECSQKTGSEFGLLIANFDVPHEQRDQLVPVVGSLINEILSESDHFLKAGKDLAIQTEDFEVVLVVEVSSEQEVETVKGRIEKIVDNKLRKYCNDLPIVPMLGIGFYPTDSDEVKELEKIARRQSREML
jgi:signal transduction histidine kinase